ncbi:hypothetical protein V6N13_033731 [Hibiscus sabdariffa]|uniref:Uncharacterized protein n=1 Tax=Hibiscus sabdariffa TaxID=183260 RepID=A0ABR2F9M7_9ROSI
MALSSVVVTIEKPSKVSLVEINGSDSTLLLEKQNAVSPKQFTWFLFLKAHRVFGSLSLLPMASKTMVSSVKKYIALSDVSEEEAKTKRLYIFIKDFLFISALALVLEVVAHLKKMEFLHHSAMRGARSPAMVLFDMDVVQSRLCCSIDANHVQILHRSVLDSVPRPACSLSRLFLDQI